MKGVRRSRECVRCRCASLRLKVNAAGLALLPDPRRFS